MLLRQEMVGAIDQTKRLHPTEHDSHVLVQRFVGFFF